MPRSNLSHEDRVQRLKDYLQRIAPQGDLERVGEELQPGGGNGESTEALEAMRPTDHEESMGLETLDALKHNEAPADIDPDGLLALEAIVHKTGRPAIDVRKNTFNAPPGIWKFLGDGPVRQRIEAAILSVGCVELPNDPRGRPYGGTGFVVGDDLMMTNRHVAEIFTDGVGKAARLQFKPGRISEVDFRREIDDVGVQPELLRVEKVIMIHPYWDMALLKVRGLKDRMSRLQAAHSRLGDLQLKLAVANPESLEGHHVVVIGYPAQDTRSDLDVQNRIFNGVYEVKRLLPGKFNARQEIDSYGKLVNAVTHDSSTLGGNSGSLVLDIDTGRVVGLHFAGEYLKANYAVSTFDLAQDSEVVDAALRFDGSVASGGDFYRPFWDKASRGQSELATSVDRPDSGSPGLSVQSPQAIARVPDAATVQLAASHQAMTWTFPVRVSISIGTPTQDSATTASIRGEVGPGEGLFSGRAAPVVVIPYSRFSAESLLKDKFDWGTALSLALASRLSYELSPAVNNTVRNVFQMPESVFIEADETQCFTMASSKAVVVSFRGTESLGDWLGNLNALSTSRSYGKVHRGFLAALQVVEAQLQPILANLNGRRLLLTGHSLGGALATVAAAEWQGRLPITWVYTYGQPAVGKGTFPQFFAKHYGKKHIRFVNDDDVVTRVPPGFVHVGRLCHFDAEGNVTNQFESLLQEAVSAATPLIEANVGPRMLTEAEFDRMRAELLEQRAQAAGRGSESLEAPITEGLIPSASDHSLDRYIAKIAAKEGARG